MVLAQKSPSCELHIWPTTQIGAVFHGANVGWNGYGAYVKGMTLTPMQSVEMRLRESIDPVAQTDAIASQDFSASERLRGYRLMFHEAPAKGNYDNWIQKDVGAGGRDSTSSSSCYAELHVIFITLFRTAISKKIQTAFLYREFGASQSATYRTVDVGSTGAPAFDSNGEEKSAVATASVRAAFKENFNIFLRKKKMRPNN